MEPAKGHKHCNNTGSGSADGQNMTNNINRQLKTSEEHVCELGGQPDKDISLYLTNGSNKLACFSLASLYSLV